MLSLFVSAAITQTWSQFLPVLLDDPVAHFDDMNSYAFLDLVRELVAEPGKGRQFIISTCDERLYRLMRQKFKRMDGKAIFYTVEAMTEKGPRIRNLDQLTPATLTSEIISPES